jgi:hypothetical protein
LKQQREHLLLLKNQWTNPMAHSLRFDEHVRRAEALARQLTGMEEPAELLWLNTVTVEGGADVGEVIDSLDVYDPNAQEAVMADLLADELEDDTDVAVQLQHQLMASDNLEPSTSETEDHTDQGTDRQDAVDDFDMDTEAAEAMVVEGSGPPQSAPVPTVDTQRIWLDEKS